MVSQEEKNYDAISTSGSMLLDIEINSNISLLNKKHYYKKKKLMLRENPLLLFLL